MLRHPSRRPATAAPADSPRRRFGALLTALALTMTALVAGVATGPAPVGASTAGDDLTGRLNAERTSRGIPALTPRSDLVDVAQRWAATMARQAVLKRGRPGVGGRGLPPPARQQLVEHVHEHFQRYVRRDPGRLPRPALLRQHRRGREAGAAQAARRRLGLLRPGHEVRSRPLPAPARLAGQWRGRSSDLEQPLLIATAQLKRPE